MLAERPLHPDVKAMFLANTPFQYAHLIKFERPIRTDNTEGQLSVSKQRYTYITDASRDVVYDDGTVDLLGNSNGPQNYVANKVLKVASVQEDTEAKASAYSVVLDGNGLGANVSGFANIVQITSTTWDITYSAAVDLLSFGFREGDKVNLSGTISGVVNIQKFRAQNTVRVAMIDTPIAAGAGTLIMSLSSDEIVSILLDKNSSSYASFINREVYIYRAYFNEGALVGTPFLLFKGIIAGVGFEDADQALTVTWNLTSHWGDFSQVKGRISSDDFHRALDQNGVPQPQSALKVAYAYDKGFSHAETSINILAKYTVQVEKQDVKSKKGFLGIGAKVKVKKYFVDEVHNTELDFQLQAKAIPVVYGVRNVSGIPIFADTLNDNSSTVYVIHALSEGEIGGIYDTYIDGNSLICNDKADYDTRSTQTDTDTVSLICRGRADRGDVLGGIASTVNTVKDFYDYYYDDVNVRYSTTLPYDLNSVRSYKKYVQPTVTNTDRTGSGITDGTSITLTSPQEITLDFFSGKAGQKAASSLVTIAKANNFKIQNDYWNGKDTSDYWGPNHRLLDTAYVVGKYIIKEGETTIPSLEFIIRGKYLRCFNYDKSYSHYDKISSESSDNFNLGDFVDLQKMDGTILLSSVQIVDKWTLRRADGSANTRFRFSVDPPLQYIGAIPSITQFKMVKGSSTWSMITYNFVELQGTVTNEWLTPISSVVNNNGYVQFNYNTTSNIDVGKDPIEQSSMFSVTESTGLPVSVAFFNNAVLVGTVSSTSLLTMYSYSAAGSAGSLVANKYLVRRNVVTLPSSASNQDDYYVDYDVTLSRLDPITGKRTSQTKRIISYSGSARIATIDGLWDYGYHPKSGDSISLSPSYADSRVSTNPAIQLMDYITSTTYGRGLSHSRDLNLQSWLETARACDEQSDVTVQMTNSYTLNPGEIYKYPASGNIIWQGSVVGTDQTYAEFNNVIGKLTYAWNSWRTYNAGELVYQDSVLYSVDTTGTQPNKPTHTSGSSGGLTALQGGLTLTRTNGTGPASITLQVNGNPVRAMENGSTIPGYSLYDADGIDYWRYVGWEEFSQRYVTRHQTNLVIDTSLPLFDNVNSLLDHFGGILRYSAGQYYLDIEEPEGLISNSSSEARNITSDHIIGKIRLTDDGIKSAFNSVTASYADPANKFESRNISFFNSTYLKIDKNVPKKGNLAVPGITNYYNTRLLADRTLNKSRFGLQASFNMAPRGTILLAGQVIQLQYPRYNWTSKKFRILNLTHQEDATVDLVVTEYDDSFYGLSNISKQAAAGLAGNSANITGIGSPIGLKASSIDSSDETNSAVSVVWINNPAANTKNVSTELYSSYSSHLYVDVASISGNTITTVENPHGLAIGEQITSMATISGLIQDVPYFIKTIPSANTIQLSTTKGGPILGLSDNANVDALLRTANLISTVAVPANSYVDVFGGIDNRVVKYYWVRHKVIQGT